MARRSNHQTTSIFCACLLAAGKAIQPWCSRRMRVHCPGSECNAELQAVTQLPGVSDALDRLMSSASVAGAPVQHQQHRHSLWLFTGEVCIRQRDGQHAHSKCMAGSQGWRLGWGLAASPAAVCSLQAGCVAVLRCARPSPEVCPPCLQQRSVCHHYALVAASLDRARSFVATSQHDGSPEPCWWLRCGQRHCRCRGRPQSFCPGEALG